MRMTEHETQTQSRLFSRTLIVAVIVCAASGLTAASGPQAELSGPIAVSGQVFDGGHLELAPAVSGNLQSLLLDGREIALVFRHAGDRLPARAQARFLTRADGRGVQHVLGVHWTDAQTGRVEQRLFRVAAVAPPRSRETFVARLSDAEAK